MKKNETIKIIQFRPIKGIWQDVSGDSGTLASTLERYVLINHSYIMENIYVINLHDRKKMSYLGTIQKAFKDEKDAQKYKELLCVNDIYIYVVTKINLL